MSKLWILSVIAAALPLSVSAHHSAAMFDMTKEVTVKGTVKSFQYTNPHSWLIVESREADGTVSEWSFETEGPSTLLRAGIKVSSVVQGDMVTVKSHPMKDGRKAGTWISVAKSDGTMLMPRGAAPPPPAAPAS